MPKRKLLKPSKKTLDAIKRSQERGIPLTEDEATLIRSSVYHLQYPKIPQGVTSEPGYDGKRRYWVEGQEKGPGSLELPIVRQVQEMERDFLTEVAKLQRRPPTEAAAKARRAHSKAPEIERALRAFGIGCRDAVKNVALQLHVSEGYVRSVRSKVRRSEGNG